MKLPLVGKCHDTLAIRSRNREEVLQDVTNTFSHLGRQVGENEMGISLTHGTNILDIVTHDCVRHVEISRGSVGKMTHNHARGLSTVLIHND